MLPPRCPRCDGLLKSDTVSFGEPIPPDVLEGCFEEAERADCMIVAGTSATVYPGGAVPDLDPPARRRPDRGEPVPVGADARSAGIALAGPAGEVLPALVERVRARGRWARAYGAGKPDQRRARGRGRRSVTLRP